MGQWYHCFLEQAVELMTAPAFFTWFSKGLVFVDQSYPFQNQVKKTNLIRIQKHVIPSGNLT